MGRGNAEMFPYFTKNRLNDAKMTRYKEKKEHIYIFFYYAVYNIYKFLVYNFIHRPALEIDRKHIDRTYN